MNQPNNLYQRVESALDTMRPYLEADGGNIEVVDITEENVVKVRLLGSCESCPMSYMTMKSGVEQAVITSVPEIIGVEAVNV